MRRVDGRLALPLWILLISMPAAAVIVSTGDGTQNLSAPAEDPGWANVGLRGGLTGIYLQNGWVLTARHVGAGVFTLDGTAHPIVPGSEVEFPSPAGPPSDLVVFKLRGQPPSLPPVALAASPPAPGEEVVLIGRGRNRGAAIHWQGRDGWLWGSGGALRWGRNRIESTGFDLTLSGTVTRAFTTRFTQGSGAVADEAQAAVGDSGGAGFVERSGAWELAGIMVAVGNFPGQDSLPDCTQDPEAPTEPPSCASAALFGNLTYLVDVSAYRSSILAVISQPACSNGLDDDGDGRIDVGDDAGCDDALDVSERGVFPCDDGVDNDLDGLRDYPDDDGCRDELALTEDPGCRDGLDNDDDGGTDWNGQPPDPECRDEWDEEVPASPASCGLGAELLALLPLMLALRRRRA